MFKAIVIGGGIGGLAAGIAFRQAGLEVEVFERAKELREVGAGITLWRNALTAVSRLGVAEALRACSVPGFSGGLRSWRGEVLIPGTAGDGRNELSLVIHRADLQSVLLQALGPDHVHLGMQCVALYQDAVGVTAEFSDGSRRSGDLLIGADGLNSAVRAQLHGPQPPIYAGYTSWRGIARFDPDLMLPGESWGYGTRFGQVPMAREQAYWYATKNVPEGQRSPGGEKAEVLRIFQGWHPPITALINNTCESSIVRTDIYDRLAITQWGRGRVTLLGDAAHPMTPNLGQGACQAIEDAVVLGHCMEKHREVEPALRSYETHRIPRTRSLVKLSRQAGILGQWQHPIAVGLRDMFMKHVGSRLQGGAQDKIMEFEV